MRGSWSLYLHIFGYRLIWFVLPHRYPVPGTKVRVNSYTSRDGRYDPSVCYDGEVVGPQYRFAGPFEQKFGFPREGVYFTGDPRWEQHWVVRLQDGRDTLEQHDLPGSEMVSGYRWGIPILHWLTSKHMRGRIYQKWRRVGNLPEKIEYYDGDYVIYAEDETRTPRMVTHFWFGLDGSIRYSLAQTLTERKAEIEADRLGAERTGRSYAITSGPAHKFPRVRAETLMLVRRGNSYFAARGEPEQLSFPHITFEVDFWKDIGVWKENVPDLTVSEAKQALKNGTIDSVHTTSAQKYTQIVLPDRFAKFRARSRKASLEYLEKFAGKYSFEVVPREVREEYEQTDF